MMKVNPIEIQGMVSPSLLESRHSSWCQRCGILEDGPLPNGKLCRSMEPLILTSLLEFAFMILSNDCRCWWQVIASKVDPDYFVKNVLDRFHVSDMLTFITGPNLQKSFLTRDHEVAMLESALYFLCTLLSVRTFSG